jgi:hypothetical protein
MRTIPRGLESPACGLAFLLALLSGCGSSDGLPRQAVSGRVTLDGKPLEAGSITFDPVDPGKAGAVSAFGAVAGGSYSIPAATGPTPGSYRVAIMASDAGDLPSPDAPPGAPPRRPAKSAAPTIPAKFNTNSTLKAEVKAGDSAPIDFELTGK